MFHRPGNGWVLTDALAGGVARLASIEAELNVDAVYHDARILLDPMEGAREEVWAKVEPYLIRGRELKARYAFDDLWEAARGPE